MTWTVEFDDAAAKELRKLDRQVQQEILRYLRERIATNEDPRRFGKPLSPTWQDCGDLSTFLLDNGLLHGILEI